jgi:hypothetical protein
MINSFHTTMRKILLLFVMLCLAQTAVKADTDLTAYDNVIFVSPATVGQKSGNEVTLTICMNNTAPIRGFQFDLHLPDGMTAVKTENGKIMASLNSDRLPQGDDHTLSVAEQADGSIRFLCGSPYNETFTDMSGMIATLLVNIEGLVYGEYPMTLKAIKLSESDISKFYEVSEIVTKFTVGYNTTDISDNQRETITHHQWYTLDGRLLNGKPTAKGVYIVNGKAVVIK